MESRDIKRRYHVTRYILVALLINVIIILFFFPSLNTAKWIFIIFAFIAAFVIFIGSWRNLNTWNKKTDKPLFYDEEFPEPTELEKENYEESKMLEKLHGKDAVHKCDVCGAPYTNVQNKCFECGAVLDKHQSS